MTRTRKVTTGTYPCLSSLYVEKNTFPFPLIIFFFTRT